jgi:hypothetical protein
VCRPVVHIKADSSLLCKFFASISVSTRACHFVSVARKLGSTPRQRDLFGFHDQCTHTFRRHVEINNGISQMFSSSLLVYRLVHALVTMFRSRESWVRLPGREIFLATFYLFADFADFVDLKCSTSCCWSQNRKFMNKIPSSDTRLPQSKGSTRQ